MSGGHFDYDQYKIRQIADDVEQIIINNGKPKPEKDRNTFDGDYYNEYSPEVIEKFKEGLHILRQAEVYVQRIDWLVSGDDGEESFLKRLKQDLEKL